MSRAFHPSCLSRVSHARRLSRLLSLVLILSSLGTTIARAAPMVDQADVLRAYAAALPIGAAVKVTPRGERAFRAILMVADDTAIVVKPRTRLARPERRLTYQELEFVELETRTGRSVARNIAIGAAAGAGTFFSLLLIFAAVVDD